MPGGTRRVNHMAHLEALKYEITARRAAIARLQLQAATGKRVRRPSDDPPAASRAVSLKLRQAANDQRSSSVQQARSWIDATTGALDAAQQLLAGARVLALQGANDSQSADSRRALGDRVDQLLESLAEAAALKTGDDHLFSGEAFDTAPYTYTRDAEGRITGAVAASGIDGDVERLLDQDLRMTINVTAPAAFGAGDATRTDAFQTLVALRDALYANDRDAVAAQIGDLQTAEDQVVAALASAGAASSRLDDLGARLDSRDLVLDSSISDAEDADMAETLIDLQNQEMVLNVALQTTARIMQLSLFDYI